MTEMDSISQQIYHSANTVQIRTREGISANLAGGILTFQLDIAKDECYLPETMYLAGRFNISSNSSVGNVPKPLGFVGKTVATNYNIGCIASGGINNIFNKAQHEISGLSGSNVVQNIENYPQAVGLLRQAFDTPLNCDDASDIFTLKSGDSELTSSGGSHLNIYTIEAGIQETPKSYIMRNMLKQRLYHQQEVTLSTKLPFAMLMEEKKLYQGSHTFRFTVASNWRSQLLNCAKCAGFGVNVADTYPVFETFDGTFVDTLTAPNQVAVQLLDLYLYAECVKVSHRPMGKQLLMFENYNTTQYSCAQTSENTILPCKPNLLKLVLGFQRPSIMLSAQAVGDAPTQALINPIGLFGFNQIALRLLRVRYLSDVYPQTDYNMQLQQTCYDDVGDQRIRSFVSQLGDPYDTSRAYQDYLNNSEFDDLTKAMSFQQWIANPIFVFKFVSTANYASSVEITMESYNGLLESIASAPVDDEYSTDPVPVTSLAGSTMYMLYVYRTIVEADFQEDRVDYKVINVV